MSDPHSRSVYDQQNLKQQARQRETDERVHRELRERFRPELLGRIDHSARFAAPSWSRWPAGLPPSRRSATASSR